METLINDKVVVTARIENFGDWYHMQQGLLSADLVRGIEVTDALVDIGASTLSMPKRLIAQLGLIPLRPRTARTAGGIVNLQTYGGAYLTVQDRVCTCDVTEIADNLPVLIGQIALEGLDLVVDTKGRRLIGNPEHGGEHVMEIY